MAGLHFDNLSAWTNHFYATKVSQGKYINDFFLIYIGVHNQDKPAPAGTLNWGLC